MSIKSFFRRKITIVNLLLIIPIFIIISVISTLITLKLFNKITSQNNLAVNTGNLVTVPTDKPIPLNSKDFSIIAIDIPKLLWIDDVGLNTPIFRLPLQISNISINPFITNLRFFECQFIGLPDGVQNGREGEIVFNPAIIPGKNVQSTMEIKLNPHVCKYDANGFQTCPNPDYSNTKLISCIADVATYSGGWGQRPRIKLQFP